MFVVIQSVHADSRQAVYLLLLGDSPQVSLSQSIYQPTDNIVVTFQNAEGNNDDWIGIYPVGSANEWNNKVGWAWTGGAKSGSVTVTLQNNTPPGIYEARLFFRDSFILEASTPLIIHSSVAIPLPTFSDNGGIEQLAGSECGAMGSQKVRKLSLPSPWNDYANDPNMEVDIYFPVNTPGQHPTVFFIAGYGQYKSERYRSLIYFVASQGYNCVFVPHKNTNPDSKPDLLLTILDNVVSQFSPAIDTKKIGYMGHSEGAGLIYYLARERANWGTQGRFLFSIAAWWGFHLPATGDVIYPLNTNLIVQVNKNDPGTDPRQNVDLLLHNNIPAERKSYLYLPGVDEGHPSDHYVSYSEVTDGVYSYDALEQVGLHRPLESLMRYSFGDTNGTAWKSFGLPDQDDINYNTWSTLNGIAVLSTDDPLGNHDVPIPPEESLDEAYLCHQHDAAGGKNPRWQMCMPCRNSSRDAVWQQCIN